MNIKLYGMNGLKLLIVCCFISVLNGGCEKEEIIPGRVALLTRKTWILSTWISQPAYPFKTSNATVKYENLLEYYELVNWSCAKIKEYTFNRGTKENKYQAGEFIYTDQVSDCSVPTVSKNGTWEIYEQSGELYLYLFKDRLTNNLYSSYKVEEISEDRLIVSYKQTVSSVNYSLQQTFIPKD